MRFFLLFCCVCRFLAANVVRDISSDSLWVDIHLNDQKDICELVFSDASRILYDYQGRRLTKITRLNAEGQELYSQTYEWDGSRLISQTGWFSTRYKYDNEGRIITKQNPWYQGTIEYNSLGQATRVGDRIYSYDSLGQITSEQGYFLAAYGEKCNLIELNGHRIAIDENNQLIGLDYDIQGNLQKKSFVYDEKNRLVEACGKQYFYDDRGRRVRKDNIYYLYLGFEEIGSFEDGKCKTLQIPGIGGPVAIEIDGKPYAPVVDAQGIVRKLIDPLTNSISKEIDCDIFGMGLTDAIPYAYRGKRYDPESSLIYFGKRYYDPVQHRWLTQDPLGPIDHENLYQYVYNNPLAYCDPIGSSFWGYVLGLGEIAAGGAIIFGGLALEVVTIGGFTFGVGVTTQTGAALIGLGLSTTAYHAQDVRVPDISWKKSQSPPYDWSDLGSDPSVCPDSGFEWKGKGKPGSSKGSWVKGQRGSQEILFPDLNHPSPIGPHWDYESPEFPQGVRIFPDGTWSPK